MLLKTTLNSNVGCVRQNNEDIILLGTELFRDKSYSVDLECVENTRFAAIVADGMGGHNGGEIASEYATQFFCDFIQALPSGLSIDELSETLKKWTTTVHQNIIQQGIDNIQYDGMGTTFVGLLFYENIILALNIGDSRLYRYRNDILKQISTDHSMRQLMNDNTLPANQIYNSLGAGEAVFIDIKDVSEQLYQDDIFLICSDGLCDMITDEEIERILSTDPLADVLVSAACKAGGKDNVSVIVMKIAETPIL